MPGAVPVIIAFAVKVGTAVVAAYKASIIVRAAIHIAATLAITAISKALAAKPGKINQGQELQLKLDPNMPRQVPVGRIATGGSQAFAFTYGHTEDVPNRYLVRIITISDRPIHGLVKVMEGSNQLTFAGSPTDGLAACQQHLKKDGSPGMWLQVVKGSDTPTALTWVVEASGGQWTAAHKGTGIAYAVVQCDYDPDAFPNGEPQLVFVVDGAWCYDDRESIAEGGSHDLEDPTTWDFTRNASVITTQLLRGFRTLDSLIIGAQADPIDFDIPSNIAAANTCDQEVALTVGTEPRYRAGMLLTASEDVESMLVDLKNAMDGEIYDRYGKITILPGGIRTPVMDLTEDDIDWTVEKSYQPLASLSSLYNHVVGSFVPESLNFIQDTYPIKKDAGYVTQDGGQKITLTQDYRAVNSDTQIQRITMRVLKSSRFQRLIAFTGPLWLLEIQQGDWFTMTSPRWGFTTKYFNARVVSLGKNLTVTIVAMETATSIDGWSPADEVPRTVDDYVPQPYRITPPFLVVSAESITDPNNNTILPGILIQLSQFIGSPIGEYELQLRKVDVPAIVTDFGLPQGTEEHSLTAGIAPNVHYELRARIRVGNEFSDWTLWKDVVTTDQFRAEEAWLFGGRTYDEIYAEILEIGTEASEAHEALVEIGEGSIDDAVTRIFQLRQEMEDSGESLFDLATGQYDLNGYMNELGYIDGEAVKAYALRRTTEAFDGIEAVVQDVSLIGLVAGDQSSFIMNESTVKVGERGSLGTVLDALLVTDGDNFAAIVAEQEARLEADEALVQTIETLELDLNGPSGSITLLQQITSDLEDDIEAVVGLAIDVNGHVTGYRFANDGTTGSLVIVADQWSFVDPSDDGNIKVPFAYDAGVLVAQNMLIREAVIEELTIGTSKIKDLAVTNWVSNFTASQQNLGASGRSTIQSVTIVSTGARLEVSANFFYYANSPSGGTFTYRFVVEEAGVDVFSMDMVSPPLVGSGDDYVVGIQTLAFGVQPSAGSHTYALRHEILTGSGFTSLYVTHAYLAVQEFKK